MKEFAFLEVLMRYLPTILEINSSAKVEFFQFW